MENAVSVVESLSWSYDVSVPASMVLKVYAKCMFDLLKMRNEGLMSLYSSAKYAKGK